MSKIQENSKIIRKKLYSNGYKDGYAEGMLHSNICNENDSLLDFATWRPVYNKAYEKGFCVGYYNAVYYNMGYYENFKISN
jgi:hypothetical protein